MKILNREISSECLACENNLLECTENLFSANYAPQCIFLNYFSKLIVFHSLFLIYGSYSLYCCYRRSLSFSTFCFLYELRLNIDIKFLFSLHLGYYKWDLSDIISPANGLSDPLRHKA